MRYVFMYNSYIYYTTKFAFGQFFTQALRVTPLISPQTPSGTSSLYLRRVTRPRCVLRVFS
jgi:hypothetical protein